MQLIRLVLATVLAVAVVGVIASSAEAHERRQVGPFVLVVGFLHEPAYLEEPNGASITVFRTGGQPVEGVDKTLKVEVSIGGDSRTFDLKPEFNRQGAYVAEFIPTRTGIYTFRFFGSIDGQEINERFESGPNRFDEVVSKAELQFPATVPSNGELAAQIRSMQPVEGQSPPQAQASVTRDELERALDRAESARTTGITVGAVGIVAGLLGLGLAAYALLSRRGGGDAGSRPEPI